MLTKTKLQLEKNPLKEISNVTGISYHRYLTLIFLQKEKQILILMDIAMKNLKYNLSVVSVAGGKS